MTSNLETAHIGVPSIAADGTGLIGQVLVSLWARKWLVLAITATALALGGLAVAVMPKQFTAETRVRGEFLALDTVVKDDKSLGIGPMSLDLGRVIETQSGLLRSHQLALRVVESLGLERLKPLLGTPDPSQSADEVKEEAAGKLLSKLSVSSDPRAYLLSVGFTARDPRLANLVADAFAAELLRNTNLQKLSQQRAYAEAILAQQLAKFGDKHPRVIDARMKLAATDSRLKEQLSKTPDAILDAAGDNVIRATAGPSGRKSVFILGVALMLGIVLALGRCLWLERNRWWSALSRY